MITESSPWENMALGMKRRVDANVSHDLYWMVDITTKYVLYIKVESANQDRIDTLKLQGISISKNIKNNTTEFFIILNDRKDEDIFLTLCLDLIEISKNYSNSSVMLQAIEKRLIRWQKFLLKNNRIEFSLQQQMGLFSELLCLKDIIASKRGIEEAIRSWVGADYDKQDFLLADMVIEVKSYKTSKTPIISISSAAQLYSDKNPFYLISYGLTPSDKGDSIDDLVLEIENIINNTLVSLEITELFLDKLFNYGYMPELKGKQHRLLVDNVMFFHISEQFPKLTPTKIDNRISCVKYSIDLLQCSEYRLNNIEF